MRLWVLCAVLGCSPEHAIGVDAATEIVDAPACIDTIDYVWADLDASAPSGSLIALHHSYAYYLFCGYYVVAFREHPRCASTASTELTLSFYSPLPPEPGDVVLAMASLGRGGGTSEHTTNATFTVYSFAPLAVGQSSFAGRFVIAEPGWNLDINVDVTTQYGESCTLF